MAPVCSEIELFPASRSLPPLGPTAKPLRASGASMCPEIELCPTIDSPAPVGAKSVVSMGSWHELSNIDRLASTRTPGPSLCAEIELCPASNVLPPSEPKAKSSPAYGMACPEIGPCPTSRALRSSGPPKAWSPRTPGQVLRSESEHCPPSEIEPCPPSAAGILPNRFNYIRGPRSAVSSSLSS